jgi:hypothetical protein
LTELPFEFDTEYAVKESKSHLTRNSKDYWENYPNKGWKDKENFIWVSMEQFMRTRLRSIEHFVVERFVCIWTLYFLFFMILIFCFFVIGIERNYKNTQNEEEVKDLVVQNKKFQIHV